MCFQFKFNQREPSKKAIFTILHLKFSLFFFFFGSRKLNRKLGVFVLPQEQKGGQELEQRVESLNEQ